ncbi:hypothetical protein [Microcystis aeruginosa]
MISQSKKLTIITATVENRLDNKSLGELRRVSQALILKYTQTEHFWENYPHLP